MSKTRIDQTRWRLGRRAFLGAAAAAALLAPGLRAEAADGTDDIFALRVIQSGHSLTDPIVPMLNAFLTGLGMPASRPLPITKSTIPGSPMQIRWEDGLDPADADARRDIADYDVLVVTERVSLANTLPWHDSEGYALRYFENSWSRGRGGEGAETILYASWIDVASGPDAENLFNDPEAHVPFRERLPLEMARWQQIADHVNANRPEGSPPMRVIPGPLIMAAVYDAIAAGEAPGLSRIEELFSDNIHINETGAYLIALAHFGVIYNRDPRMVPARVGGMGPQDAATAEWMQELVHEVLLDYPDAGYTGGS